MKLLLLFVLVAFTSAHYFTELDKFQKEKEANNARQLQDYQERKESESRESAKKINQGLQKSQESILTRK